MKRIFSVLILSSQLFFTQNITQKLDAATKQLLNSGPAYSANLSFYVADESGNFIYEYQVRIHTEAICTDVYVSETGYPRVVIEFSLIDSEAIKELGNTFKLALPSINQAVEKPYSYNVLFKSVAYDIPMDDQGNVDLVDLKGKSFALSIEKKSFDNGDVVPRLINLIAYRD